MNRTNHTTFLAFALMLALCGSVTAATLEETEEQTLPFAPGNSLELSNTNGNIHLESWDQDEIRIEARKKAKAGDADSARKVMEAIEIEISQAGNTTRVETRLPRKGDGISAWLSGRNVSASVSYRIRVPATADLDLESVNGGVKVEAVRGLLDLRSTNGAIHVLESGGSVSASTTNGSIEVDLEEVDSSEDMSMRTTNGSIRLRLPAGTSADLSARTTNGSIHSDLPIQVRGSMSRRKIEGEINGGGGKLDLRTTNGSIKILEQ